MGLLSKTPKPKEVYDAVKNGQKDLVEELIKKKADVNGFQDEFTGDYSLHAACNKNNKDVVEVLIKANAKVNSQNKLGQTPMHCAAGYGYVGCIELLIAAGARKDLVDNEGLSAAEYAKNYDQEAAVAALSK